MGTNRRLDLASCRPLIRQKNQLQMQAHPKQALARAVAGPKPTVVPSSSSSRCPPNARIQSKILTLDRLCGIEDVQPDGLDCMCVEMALKSGSAAVPGLHPFPAVGWK